MQAARIEARDLLECPRVRVAKSSIRGAGDGVYAARDIAMGELITWDEPSRGKALQARQSYFEWFERYGAYCGADSSRRCPSTGPVGHVLNDAACVRPLEWKHGLLSAEPGEIWTYARDSIRRANVDVVKHSDVLLCYAARDVEEGEELFRFYGAKYWLGHLENSLMHVMNLARVDLRLVASLLGNRAIVTEHARELFSSCANRIDTLEAEYNGHVRHALGLEEYERRVVYRDFDGYGAWPYITLTTSHVRRAAATRLNVYEQPFLPDLGTVRDVLLQVHSWDEDEFTRNVVRFVDPPFNSAHYGDFKRCRLSVGQHAECPW